MRSKFLTILPLVLVCIVLPTQRASGTYTLSPATNTEGYVDNLISSYNALVPSNAPNFDSIKGYYALYHAIGNTFEVLVMRSDNTTQVVVLNFIPIGGNDPIVIMDGNDTFVGAYKLFDFQAGNDAVERITFSYQNTNVAITLAYSVDWSDITGAYMVNSKNAAEYLYHSDVSRIPQSPNQVPDPFGFFNDNPIVKTLNSLSGILFVSGLVVTAFIVIKRKEVKERLGIGQPPKHRNQTQKHRKNDHTKGPSGPTGSEG
jgi:hypothetical protein